MSGGVEIDRVRLVAALDRIARIGEEVDIAPRGRGWSPIPDRPSDDWNFRSQRLSTEAESEQKAGPQLFHLQSLSQAAQSSTELAELIEAEVAELAQWAKLIVRLRDATDAEASLLACTATKKAAEK